MSFFYDALYESFGVYSRGSLSPDVERAFRFCKVPPHGIQAINNDVAAALERCFYLFDFVHNIIESSDSGMLYRLEKSGIYICFYLRKTGDNVRIANSESATPACHAVSL